MKKEKMKENNRCIILTTHSMEEAEVLSDRIAIMARGRLKCVGTLLKLKKKFGKDLHMELKFNEKNKQNIMDFVKKTFAGSDLMLDNREGLVYKLDNSIRISDIFKEVESSKVKLGISDWIIQQTNLEDVFLNIVKLDEADEIKEEEHNEKLAIKDAIKKRIGRFRLITKNPSRGTQS